EAERLWVRTDELEAREHRGFGLREREEQPVAQALGDPTATTAYQRSDRAVVIGEETARRLVALARRERGEVLEIGERDGESFAGPFARIVLRSGREDLDRRQAQRREERRALLDRALEVALDHLDGCRGGEGSIAGALEPLPADQAHLDRMGEAVGAAREQGGDQRGQVAPPCGHGAPTDDARTLGSGRFGREARHRVNLSARRPASSRRRFAVVTRAKQHRKSSTGMSSGKRQPP